MKSMKLSFMFMAVLLIAGIASADTTRLGKVSMSYNPTNIVTKTTTYTILATDSEVRCDAATTGAFTSTLPKISTSFIGISKSYKLKKSDSGVNVCTFAAATGDTIGGETSRKVIAENGYIIIQSGPNNDWVVTAETPYLIEDHGAGTTTVTTATGFTSNIVFEGSTADGSETTIAVTDPTADVTYQFPDAVAGTYYPMVSTLATNAVDKANAVWGVSNGLVFEGATANGFELTLSPTDVGADYTVTLPGATGTVALTAGAGSNKTVVAGSGTTTVTAADCGKVYTAAADADGVFNLPATVAGCKLTFINIGAATNNLLTINPDNADQIFGTITLAASVVVMLGNAGDAVSNTKGTSVRGDSMTLIGDGADGWYIVSSTGIWADVN